MKLQSIHLSAFVLPVAVTFLGSDVEHPLVAQEQRWVLSPEPVVQIGIAFGRDFRETSPFKRLNLKLDPHFFKHRLDNNRGFSPVGILWRVNRHFDIVKTIV